jgi:ribulose-5-phosphate 4-epimerase/fuculose-1-phosphate aldolase
MSDVRDELCAAARRLDALGLSPGASGNVSAREGERMLITPTGISMGEIRPQDLSVVDATSGEWLEGPKPSKEWPLHQALYGRDSSAGAVVHLHSTKATAMSCLPPWADNSALPPLTPYFVMRVGQTPLIPYAAPGSHDQAVAIAASERPFRAVLLQNHGPITAGPGIDEAVAAAIELEEVAKLLLLLRDRSPVLLNADQITELTEKYGTVWEV